MIIVIVTIIFLINIFFGEKNLLKLGVLKNEIQSINQNLSHLKIKKDRLDFYLKEYERNNTDFIESLIRKKLNYRGNNEKVYYIK